MATNAQRVQAIGDALINGTATQAQLSRLGRALAYSEARLAEFDAATPAQQAGILLACLLTQCKARLKDLESQEAVASAKATAAAQVDADFVAA
jgi:hypothetical protein